MASLHTELIIRAPRPKVWGTLIDWASYSEWNPFVRSIEGTLEVGRELTVTLSSSGRPVVIRPRLIEVEPGYRFAWLGHLGVRGLFDGRHRFELQDVAEGTRFVHAEQFSGWLVRPVLWMLGASTEAGFRAMNEALRARCEG